MGRNIKILDTNVLVRYLTRDDSEQSDAVEQMFRDSDSQILFEIPDVVFFEVFFVLFSVYDYRAELITKQLRALIESQKISCNKVLLRRTMDYHENYNISFVDAYLVAKSILENSTLVTFDKKLLKIPDLNASKPD
jgi:predicted nucleic-acid-binding protein